VSVLDIGPGAPRRSILGARVEAAREAHAFLGVELSAGEDGGVTVRSVRAGSPAAKAGVETDDRIVSFNGVTALAPVDVAPNGRESAAVVRVVRGEEPTDLAIDVTGYRGDASREIVGAAAVIGTLLIVVLLFASRLGSALTWIVHRLERAGGSPRAKQGRLAGLIRRATRAPEAGPASSNLAAALPVLAFAGATATFAILPWFELRGRSEVDVTLLYLVSLTSFATMGLVTGGWTEVGPGIFGRLRALGTVLVCELPAACALGAVVLRTGSVRASDIAAAQVGSQGNTIETGGFPWYWNAVKSPLVFLLFACFFLTLLVDGSSPNKAPEGADADATTPGSSLRRAAFLFAEWANVLVMCAIGTLAFLGGWYVPDFGVHEHAQSDWLVALGVGWFLVKCWMLAGLVLALRAALPRLSPVALMKAGYRAMLPLAVVALGASALVTRYPLLPSVERAATFATLSVALIVAAVVVVGARARRSDARTPRRFARVNTML